VDGEVDGSADLRPCDARRGASGRCTRAVTVRSVSHPGHARASYLILWRAAAVTRVIKNYLGGGPERAVLSAVDTAAYRL